MIHGHGNDAYKYGHPIIADFSSNVWFEGPSENLLNHLQEKLGEVINYPNPEASLLKEKIAGLYGVGSENILISNGAVEAIYIIASTYRNQHSSIITPCFSEYEDACRIHDHDVTFISNSEPWYDRKFGKRLVWFGNPNNPDGKIISLKTLEQMLYNNPETTFIVDEAYAELCTNFQSALPLIQHYTNLLILRSFTKSFSIPGLRLGVLIGGKHHITHFNSCKMPWSVNVLAIEAGNYIIDHYSQLIPNPQQIKHDSNLFQQTLEKIPQITVIPSKCNYCLVKLTGQHATILKQFLVEKYGVLIRDSSNFHGLDKKYIRVAVRKPEHNAILRRGLQDWLKTGNDE